MIISALWASIVFLGCAPRHNGPSDLTGRQIALEILAFQEERCYKPLALYHFSHRRLTAMTTLVAALLALMARHETHWQLTNRETI